MFEGNKIFIKDMARSGMLLLIAWTDARGLSSCLAWEIIHCSKTTIEDVTRPPLKLQINPQQKAIIKVPIYNIVFFVLFLLSWSLTWAYRNHYTTREIMYEGQTKGNCNNNKPYQWSATSSTIGKQIRKLIFSKSQQ